MEPEEHSYDYKEGDFHHNAYGHYDEGHVDYLFFGDYGEYLLDQQWDFAGK